MDLPAPARYTPWAKGVYDVTPNLRPLGTDFGNGGLDRKLFQIDREFPRYREAKLASRAERLDKYFVTNDLRPEVEQATVRFLVARLCKEHPHLFRWDGRVLRCELTDEQLEFDEEQRLLSGGTTAPPYASALDALLCQIQEDLVVVATDGPRDWAAALHVCLPSHWAPAEKAGMNFIDAHEPVPGFERVVPGAAGLVRAMVERGPFVRFVWAPETDDRLNHHPEAPPGQDPREWWGRRFDRGRLWIRTERQVLWGLPEVGAALFSIRVGFVSGEEIQAEPALRASLRSALLSMSPEARRYKGVDEGFDELSRMLEERAAPSVAGA